MSSQIVVVVMPSIHTSLDTGEDLNPGTPMDIAKRKIEDRPDLHCLARSQRRVQPAISITANTMGKKKSMPTFYTHC